MKSLLLLIMTSGLLMLTQACNKAEKLPEPEESCHFKQNVYQQRVSWAWTQGEKVKLYSDASMPDEMIVAMEKAIAIWNETFKKKFGYEIFVYAGDLKGKVGVADDTLNVVSYVAADENWDGDKKAQADTYLRWAGKVIYDADVRLNGKRNLTAADEIEKDQLDAVALLVHEFGHVLGLDHIITDEYTTMAVMLSNGTTERREISKTDIDALRCEY